MVYVMNTVHVSQILAVSAQKIIMINGCFVNGVVKFLGHMICIKLMNIYGTVHYFNCVYQIFIMS